MRILGIETSCDETAASVVEVSRGRVHIRSHIVNSQIPVHRKYGGVVPEVAAREHVRNIVPVVDEALRRAGIVPNDLDSVAVTKQPGLLTSLLVGVETARALAWAWSKPLIPVNHLAAHVASGWLPQSGDTGSLPKFSFPIVALIASGGHTEFWSVARGFKTKHLGGTLDDAAGEAFDKVASLLHLGYPGGPALAAAAQAGESNVPLPRPMFGSKNLAMSFAGLKTAVAYGFAKRQYRTEDVAASFQQAVVDVLAKKTLRVIEVTKAKTLFLVGGVAANDALRERLRRETRGRVRFVVPQRRFCTDNATMVALAAALMPKRRYTDPRTRPS
jgi:N6-L-threonylcarbamoyladenine synthase